MDPNTAVILLSVNLISNGALLFLIVRKTPGLDGARLWAWGATTFGASYVGLLVAGGLLRASNPVSILLDCTMVAAALMFIAGLRLFVGHQVDTRLLLTALVLQGLLECVAAWLWGTAGRLSVLNLGLGALYLLLAFIPLRASPHQAPESRPPLRLLSVLMLGLGALTAWRGALIAVSGSLDAAYRGIQSQIYYGYASFAAMLLAMTLLWLVFVRLNGQLAELATRDPLSKALNRNGLAVAMKQHFAARAPRPLTLMILDIDHFKRVNDQHGHGVGDRLIEALALTLQQNLRAGDFLARIGGEEFLVACVDSGDAAVGVGGASLIAERLRAAVQSLSLPLGHAGSTLACTVSIGVSRPVCALSESEAAQGEADKALYRAKASGRNRVEWAAAG